MRSLLLLAVCAAQVISGLANTTGDGLRLLIVGGYATVPREVPYLISLQYFGMHSCGGAIINDLSVVTAAHCVDGDPVSAFTVVAGEYSLSKDDGTEQRRNITSIVIHEDYQGYVYGNDIAVLKLMNPLDFNEVVQPLPVAPQGHQAKGTAVISGWGTISPQGTLPDTPSTAEVTIFPDTDCQTSYGELISNTMLCAGDKSGGKDACRGDSGGPLVASDLRYDYLAGVVSWGIRCALAEYPGVYTEVASFSDWVRRHTV